MASQLGVRRYWENPKSHHIYEVLNETNFHNCSTGEFYHRAKVRNLRKGNYRVFGVRDFKNFSQLSTEASAEIYYHEYVCAQSSSKCTGRVLEAYYEQGATTLPESAAIACSTEHSLQLSQIFAGKSSE